MPCPDRRFLVLMVFVGVAMGGDSHAFNSPVEEREGFRASLHTPKDIPVSGAPFSATVELSNGAPVPARIDLRVFGVEGWVCESENGEDSTSIDLKPNETIRLDFLIRPATDTLTALYPLHALCRINSNSGAVELHPIAIVGAEAAVAHLGDGTCGEAIRVEAESALRLLDQPGRIIEFVPDQGALTRMPGSWTGMDPESGAVVGAERSISRTPEAAPGFSIHPPWRKGPGAARISWQLALPEETPITFGSAVAIRDTGPSEPPSDGVTFRVRIDQQIVYEEHTDSKSWHPLQVDLSRYAGRQVLLSIESDVGPKRDPTCDLSHWRQPWIHAGEAVPSAPDTRDVSARVRLARASLEDDLEQGSGTEGVALFVSESCRFALVPGPHGFLDAGCAIGAQEPIVGFSGVQIEVEGEDPLDPLSPFRVGQSTRMENRFRTILWKKGTSHWVELAIEPGDGAVELRLDSDLSITDFSVGRFDAKADQIFAGVGNVLRRPRAPFTLEADGHRLATRHVGLRFEDGANLVMACTNPPDRLEVNPDRNEYSLHTHMPGSIHLVPSDQSPFDAAIRYRKMAGLRPGPGVERLKGRFSFDLWGGRYQETADQLEWAARYGLTHSLVVFHNWQRWGYDYRLPDIYPPNPDFGSLAEFRRLREVCRKHGILFAPHDNYIDLYPDWSGFSYDLVCFDALGNPIKGWLNEGRQAQAYRFRPDKFLPMLEKNLQRIKEGFDPDAYFVDVFSSIGAFDYYSRQGEFHDYKETVEHWNKGFDRIRELLGGDAPQISESGTDNLLGHLDAAQSNHIRVDPKDNWISWRMDCEESERIPWQDAVMHDTFILQGVGYPTRYASGQDLIEHGIHSDDYLSDEVLTGHAPMVDAPFGRPVVRKYWLLHDFLHEIAAQPISSVEFVDGNIHRQRVTYAGGAVVHVNRDTADWILEGGRVLPPYGFLAEGGATLATVYRREGRLVEESRSPGMFFADGRGIDCRRLTETGVEPTDFGWCRTNAGIRVQGDGGKVLVTPLPGGKRTEISLHRPTFGLASNARAWEIGLDGTRGETDLRHEGDFVTWMLSESAFQYEME